MENEINLSIKHCPRCAGEHETVKATRLKRSIDKHTHYGFCPSTQEPVLFFNVDPEPLISVVTAIVGHAGV